MDVQRIRLTHDGSTSWWIFDNGEPVDGPYSSERAARLAARLPVEMRDRKEYDRKRYNNPNSLRMRLERQRAVHLAKAAELEEKIKRL